MTQIQKTVAICVVAGMALSSSSAFAQSKPDDERAVGSKVTLSTCVEKGQKADTFVMTHVAAVPAHAPSHGRVVYWFDSVKPLRAHVGHQVNIMGTITDVDSEEMEVKLGEDGKGGWTVEVEGPGRDVKATPAQLGVSTAGRKSGKADIQTTVVKVKIDTLTMVSASCSTM
ncbi:MAG: hypothetical protein Q7R30_23345 [Acidobacteriota bacterium]|nr:hypothetical protein [Acidobacteriota bacterium]